MLRYMTQNCDFEISRDFIRLDHVLLVSCLADITYENPSGNIRRLSWAFCTRQQGLNVAGVDHIWKFSPLNGFNYHQLASTQALALVGH